jgi:hypothetical protein
MPHPPTAVSETQECIQNCLECRQACKETLAHCMNLGGDHAAPAHLQTLIDCVVVCHASADLMTGGSDLHPRQCGVCAEACRRCAESCERVAPDDSVMSHCAEVCHRCAESCAAMSRM